MEREENDEQRGKSGKREGNRGKEKRSGYLEEENRLRKRVKAGERQLGERGE